MNKFGRYPFPFDDDPVKRFVFSFYFKNRTWDLLITLYPGLLICKLKKMPEKSTAK